MSVHPTCRQHICQEEYVILSAVAQAAADRSLAPLFRALADPTRLRLLNLMADRDICVCYFVEILGISQPKISRHLAYLRKVGLVAARREGKWMHYRLAVPQDDIAAGILRETLRQLSRRPAMQQDVARLMSACCAPEKYVLIQGAPAPRFSCDTRPTRGRSRAPAR